VHQRVDHEARDPQHDDLAEGVVAAEVHEDDVDDVRAAAALVAVGDVVVGDRLDIAHQERVGQPADAAAGAERDHTVADFQARGLSFGVTFGMKCSARSSSMIVTVSTEICVSARSGAER
jgi:hypothetical protein